MALKQVKTEDIVFNPFTSLMKEWALVTVRSGERINTLTIGWGGFGVLWQRYIATIYIRPCRYSKELLDNADSFSITFLPDTYRDALLYCGKVSGRDEDKIKGCGLTLDYRDGVPYFKEGKRVFFAKKIYSDVFREENFADSSISDSIYPEKDYHTMYLAEITAILEQE